MHMHMTQLFLNHTSHWEAVKKMKAESDFDGGEVGYLDAAAVKKDPSSSRQSLAILGLDKQLIWIFGITQKYSASLPAGYVHMRIQAISMC